MCIKRKRRGIPHGKEPMFVNVRGGECVSSSCGIPCIFFSSPSWHWLVLTAHKNVLLIQRFKSQHRLHCTAIKFQLTKPVNSRHHTAHRYTSLPFYMIAVFPNHLLCRFRNDKVIQKSVDTRCLLFASIFSCYSATLYNTK